MIYTIWTNWKRGRLGTSPQRAASTTRRSPWSPGRRALSALLGAGLGLLFATAPTAASEATEEARAVVDRTAEEVLEILRAPDLTDEERRERIEAIAFERFDFQTISKLVLARDWRRFDRGQRKEFVRSFKEFLSHTYGIERYDEGSMEITGTRPEPRGDVTVQTRIVGGEADGIVVHYRLRRSEGRWRVIDLIIEGISMVSSYREQFSEVMSREGPEGLLQRLRDKTAAPPPGLDVEA